MEKVHLNILFLTLGKIDDVLERGLYNDLLRHFSENGHRLTIMSPYERRDGKKTEVIEKKYIRIIRVKTFNIQKTNIIEKGIGTLAIEYQYLKALKKFDDQTRFDLILYSTPPITFSKIIKFVKKRDNAISYLLLKDIFPQNAVDMKMMAKGGLIYKYFRKKEKNLYDLSDYIGAMSKANVNFIITQNKTLNPKKIEVNPNSIKPINITKNSNEIKTKYKINKDATVFLYGGNLGKPQGLDFLVEVLKANKNNTHAFFIIAGNGTESEFIKKSLIGIGNAIFIQKLPKTDYDNLIAGCDVGLIFLHPDFTIPNFPSRLLSYLEYKMPIISATDKSTDIGDIIENANAGFKVYSGDLEKMQRAIDFYINNPDKLTEHGQNAYKLLLDNYTISVSYNLIIEKCIKNI